MTKLILLYISFLRDYLFKNNNAKGNNKPIIDSIIINFTVASNSIIKNLGIY